LTASLRLNDPLLGLNTRSPHAGRARGFGETVIAARSYVLGERAVWIWTMFGEVGNRTCGDLGEARMEKGWAIGMGLGERGRVGGRRRMDLGPVEERTEEGCLKAVREGEAMLRRMDWVDILLIKW
jgi:hypothetical protein